MRIIGYIVGFWMLFNGIMTAMSPRWWTDTTMRATEKILPPEQASVVEEYSMLSPNAIRYGGFVETAISLIVLGLASSLGSRRHTYS